jgi:ABC-type antimicrobial peptide transport system permease subunit
MPRELATLVHTELTVIVDAITERCLAIGANVVWEGTFSWPGLGRRLLTELAEADYQKLTILDVEAPVDITKARALSRWLSTTSC